jgi:hypothetical protein
VQYVVTAVYRSFSDFVACTSYHGTKNFPADILAVRHESEIIPFRTTALLLLLILGFSSTMTNQYIRITMFGLIYQTDILQVHAVSQI